MKTNYFMVVVGILFLAASAFGVDYQAYSFKSDDGFSGVQGENGWSYAGVRVDGTDDIDVDKFMAIYDPCTAIWTAKDGGSAWNGVNLSATSQNMQYPIEDTASLRYWTADKDYTWVNIYSTLVSVDPNVADPCSSGGCLARVYHRDVGTPEGEGVTICDSIADFTEPILVSGGVTLADSEDDYGEPIVLSGGVVLADSIADFEGATIIGGGVVIADSEDDFSGTQGSDGWRYYSRFLATSSDPNWFEMTWDSGASEWVGTHAGAGDPCEVRINATSQQKDWLDTSSLINGLGTKREWASGTDYSATGGLNVTVDFNVVMGRLEVFFYDASADTEWQIAQPAAGVGSGTWSANIGDFSIGDKISTVLGPWGEVNDVDGVYQDVSMTITTPDVLDANGWSYELDNNGAITNMIWDPCASEYVGTGLYSGEAFELKINATSQMKNNIGGGATQGPATRRGWTADTAVGDVTVTGSYDILLSTRCQIFHYDASEPNEALRNIHIVDLVNGVGAASYSVNIDDIDVNDMIYMRVGPYTVDGNETSDEVYQDASMTITTVAVLDANGWSYEVNNNGVISDMIWDSGAGNYVGVGTYSGEAFELRINETSMMKNHIGGGTAQGPASRRGWTADANVGDVTVTGTYDIILSSRFQLFHYDASTDTINWIRDIVNGGGSGSYSQEISGIDVNDVIYYKLGPWVLDPCDPDRGDEVFQLATMTIKTLAVYDANGWEYTEYNNGNETKMDWDPGEGDYVINGAFSGQQYQLRQNASQMMQAKIGGGATQGVGTWRTWTSDANYIALYPKGVKLSAYYDVAAGRVQLFYSDASAGGAFTHIADLVNGSGAGTWSIILDNLDVGDKIRMKHMPWVSQVANEVYQDFSIKITNIPEEATGVTTELGDWAVDVGVHDMGKLAWGYPAYTQLHNVKAGEKIYFLLKPSPTSLYPGDNQLMKEWISEIIGYAPTTPVSCPSPIWEDIVADCNVEFHDYTALSTGFGTDYTPAAPDPNVYNSIADFSTTTQGENNWYYGYLLDEDDINDIHIEIEPMVWNGAWSSWDRNFQHPRINATSQTTLEGVAASARYWIVPEDREKLEIETTIETTVTARFMIVFVDIGTDAGKGQIIGDVTSTDAEIAAGGGTQTITMDTTVPNVITGDAVYFVMQGSGDGFGDGIFVPWEQTITISGADDCLDRILLGNGMPADLEPDCKIDFYDLDVLLQEWLTSY